MPTNVELKALCAGGRDALDRVRVAALAAGATPLGVDHQTDTYFRVTRGRLKLRQSTLDPGGGGAAVTLIPYLREDALAQVPRRSDYALLRASPDEEGEAARHLLATILGIETVIVKRRESLALPPPTGSGFTVVLHLDDVADLGAFVELVAVLRSDAAHPRATEAVRGWLALLGLQPTDCCAGSYRELSVIRAASPR